MHRIVALTILCFFVGVTVGRLGAETPSEIKVVAYNLKNYLVMERPDAPGEAKPKPEDEIAALVDVLRQENPDVLGVCEIGARDQLADLRGRLAKAGLEFKDEEWIEAEDTTRHLALLSKFPIVARNSKTDASYELRGRVRRVQRGFLDVTVQVNPEYALRLVGVHLKSKLPIPEGEAIVRRNEAALLRKYFDGILEADPKTNLLAYGDFNDTKEQPVIKDIMGPRGSDTQMRDVWSTDAVGDRWTYFRGFTDGYERIDYLFASNGLWPEIVKEKSGIHRSPDWNKASDHRAIFTVIRASDAPNKR